MQTIRFTDPSGAHSLTVDRAALQGVRPMRGNDGALLAEVRETSAGERAYVVNKPFAAAWVGWHRGCTPGYGRTPEDAVRNLAAGRVAE